MSHPTCPKCGTSYPQSAAFCSHCGEKLSVVAPTPQAPMNTVPTPQTFSMPQPSTVPSSSTTPIPTQPIGAPTYQTPAYLPPNQYAAGEAVASVGLEKVGFGPRLVAALVDGIILSVLYQFVGSGILQLVISLAYYTYMTSQYGWTVGKRLMNIRVVNLDGSALNYQQAAIRYFCYIVSALPLCIGYLAVLWDPNRQGWHDKIAGTYVVKG